MCKHLVYALVDPRDHLVYYVGQSSRGMTRPKVHRYPSVKARNPVKGAWLDELTSAGADPEIVVLDCLDVQPSRPLCWWAASRRLNALNDAELWWISFGRACGWPLTNQTRGGNGFRGRHTEATKRRIGAASKGRVASALSRQRMSEGRKAAWAVCSPERRAEIGKAISKGRELRGLRPCGTRAAYARGCRCPKCRRAEQERKR